MAADKSKKESNGSSNYCQRNLGSPATETSDNDLSAARTHTKDAQPSQEPVAPPVAPRSSMEMLAAANLRQEPEATFAAKGGLAAPSGPTSPRAASAPDTPYSPPHGASATTTAPRSDSKAARALQQLSAACRRISEVGQAVSAVTSAAASWVLPAASRRRSSALWVPDPEAGLSLTPSNSNSNSSALGSVCSPATTPRKLSAQPRLPPGARRFGSASHSCPQGPDVSPGSGSALYGSANTAVHCLPPAAAGGRGATRSCTAPLPALPPTALPPAALVSAPFSPPYRPLPSGHQNIGAAAAAAACAAAGTSGSDGVFKPRATPSDGLLYLAPSARAVMWSPQRGTRWSLQQYELHRRLYRGYASTVYKATCTTSNSEVVLKVYSLATLTDFLRHQVLRELDIHSRLRHPGIVQLLAAFREGDTLVMVLELVRGGSLDQARKRLGGRMGEQWALHLVVLPLLRVLSHLHRLGVVHRDIKPENILFTPDWRLKLCDFGVSIYLAEERAVTRAGSSEYMAPEVNACPLKRTPADNKVNEQLAYGAACDVWSLGAVVYELLVGFPPFPGGPPPGLKGDAARRGRTAGTGEGGPAGSGERSATVAEAEGSRARSDTAGAAKADVQEGEGEAEEDEPPYMTAGGAAEGCDTESGESFEAAEEQEAEGRQEEEGRDGGRAEGEATARGAAAAGAEAAIASAPASPWNGKTGGTAVPGISTAGPRRQVGFVGAAADATATSLAADMAASTSASSSVELSSAAEARPSLAPESAPAPAPAPASEPLSKISPGIQHCGSTSCSPCSSASCSASSSSSPTASSSAPSALSSLAFPSRLSPTGRSFLLACLEPHAGDRPSTEELMQHPWVVGAQQTPLAEDSGSAPPCAPPDSES